MAEVFQQHLVLGGGRGPAAQVRGQPGQSHLRDAARGGARVGVGVGSAVGGGRAPRRGVVDVVDVDVGPGGPAGVDHEAQQAAVPVVVDRRAQVGEHRGGGVVHVVVGLDHPPLLGDEQPAIGGEGEGGRLHQARLLDREVEAGRRGAGGEDPEDDGDESQSRDGARGTHRLAPGASTSRLQTQSHVRHCPHRPVRGHPQPAATDVPVPRQDSTGRHRGAPPSRSSSPLLGALNHRDGGPALQERHCISGSPRTDSNRRPAHYE